ncbi:MAG TPA: hypothetical protein VGX76_09845 [Pirellulales bacterium]|nr:hypothetical protein [Pirellulales bacterium]
MNVAQIVKRLGDQMRRRRREAVVDFVTLVRAIADGAETDDESVLAILAAADKSFEQLAEAVNNEQRRRIDMVTIRAKGELLKENQALHLQGEALKQELKDFTAQIIARKAVIAARVAEIHVALGPITAAEYRLASSDLGLFEREAKAALCDDYKALATREATLRDLLNPTGGSRGAMSNSPGRKLTDARQALAVALKNRRHPPAPVSIEKLERDISSRQETVNALQKELDGIAAKRAALQAKEYALSHAPAGTAADETPR